MVTVRDFVRRFRPAGAPGPAAPAGVPSNRIAELAAELAPVFDALRELNGQAADLIAEAGRAADRRRADAVAEAEELVTDARRRAEASRAAAASAAVEDAVEERDALLDGARRDAAEINRRAAERLPRLVDRVVAVVRTTGSDLEAVR
jgi:vacuolar-type H+-ATPase subunit H